MFQYINTQQKICARNTGSRLVKDLWSLSYNTYFYNTVRK